VDVYIRLGNIAGPEVLRLASQAEAAGFDGAVLSDHLFFPEHPRSRYPYSPDGRHPFRDGVPWPDPIVTIAAIAAVTNLNFVTSVYLLALRHPLVAAKAIATAACLAPNRLSIGVGVGWQADEYEAVGVDFQGRGSVLEESIATVRELVSPHRGPWCQANDGLPSMSFEPRSPSRVPILIGGPSARAIRRAVEIGDGYIGVGSGCDEVSDALSSIRGLLNDRGRDVGSFPIHLASPAPPTLDELLTYHQAGLDVLHVVPWDDPLAAATSPDQKSAALERFADALLEFRRRCEAKRQA
jgi:probable F420-dependent oxidoreductase